MEKQQRIYHKDVLTSRTFQKALILNCMVQEILSNEIENNIIQ